MLIDTQVDPRELVLVINQQCGGDLPSYLAAGVPSSFQGLQQAFLEGLADGGGEALSHGVERLHAREDVAKDNEAIMDLMARPGRVRGAGARGSIAVIIDDSQLPMLCERIVAHEHIHRHRGLVALSQQIHCIVSKASVGARHDGDDAKPGGGKGYSGAYGKRARGGRDA
jgi:hypothetical protein